MNVVDRFEDAAHPKELPPFKLGQPVWEYYRERATGIVFAVLEAFPESHPNEDGGGSGSYSIAWTSLQIVENGERRDLTNAEEDEYIDDVRAFLKSWLRDQWS